MDHRGLAGRDRRGCRPPLARADGRINDYRRALPEERQGFLNREVSPFEIDGYHFVEALLCHLFEQQELAVTCIYEDAVQVPEFPFDRGEHRVEVGEIADVRANGETSGSKRLLSRLQRPLIQAADGDARALSVELLRRGQPDPAVAAGDKDVLASQLNHRRHSFGLKGYIQCDFRSSATVVAPVAEPASSFFSSAICVSSLPTRRCSISTSLTSMASSNSRRNRQNLVHLLSRFAAETRLLM